MKKPGIQGFTMLEMLTVLSIMGILVSIALSSMYGYVERTKLRNSVELVAAHIRQARWLARSRSATCTIVFDTASQAYVISGEQASALPDGVRFGIDPTVNGRPSDPYTVPPQDGVSFNSGSNNHIARFYPSGVVAPTGAVYITDGKETMAITVAITGRPKIWKSCGGRRWVSL
jgi:prepilin-type N-terminal cleavage/methylation domain-containing protein